MKLSIRKVTPADIGPVARMVKALHEESDVGYPIIDDTELEKCAFMILQNLNNPECLFLIAFDGKKPIGFFMGNIGRHPYGKPEIVGHAEQLYVVPEKRGGPVGFALIRKAVQYAVQMGAQGFEAVGVYGKSDQRWIKLGFQPYITYLQMSREDMAKLAFPEKNKPVGEANEGV